MERTAKKALVTEMHDAIKSSEIVLVTHNKGLTVAEVTKLRVQVRKAGARYKVLKNRLAKIAIKDTNYGKIEPLMKGPTAITIAKDPVAAAKVISEFAKLNEKLVILGGVFGENVLDAKGIQHLATMPSLDELRGKIVGLLQAPAQRIATVLQAPAAQLARVTGAYAKKG